MVVYLTPGVQEDPYSGATVPDWSTVTRTEAPSAFVLSSSTTVATDGGNALVQTRWTLYVPEGEAEPRDGDRVEFSGEEFVMDGRPIREANPFTGWAPYSQVTLNRRTGR